MKLPKEIQQFIEKQIKLNNYCLPQFYPSVDSFSNFQIGYKIHAHTGEQITGTNEGDFRENWLVICSGYGRDPFIIDINEAQVNFPVYFLSKKSKKWNPIKVANTIETFSHQLVLLKKHELNGENLQVILTKKFDLTNEFWQEVFKEAEEYED